MRVRFSKRYLRTLVPLVVVVTVVVLVFRDREMPEVSLPRIPNTTYAAQRPDPAEAKSDSWSKEEVGSLLASNKISLDSSVDLQFLDLNRLVITGVGLKKCYHAAGRFERCSTKVPKGLPEVPFADRTLEYVIPKDLRGSVGFHWYGNSEYVYFDALTLGALLEAQATQEIYALVDVSSTPFPESSLLSVKVHNLYFVFQKFTLAELLADPRQAHTVSKINVLFGSDCKDPRDFWHLIKSEALLDGYRFPSYISFEKKPVTMRAASTVNPALLAQDGRNFKIVQLADLHMGVGENKCLDEFPATDDCHADPKTFKFIDSVLNIEKPDMVVFTGDQIMGDRSIQDSESTLLKVLDPVIKRQIPWAMVWGNHDDEGSLSRWELSQLATTLPYSLFKMSPYDTPDNRFGVGNYVQQVRNATDPSDVLMTFYFLDSHKYSTTGKLYPGYDWIKESQLAYMIMMHRHELSPHIPTHKPHVSMAFFHIPLPEYLDFESKKHPGQQNPLVGTYKEGVTAPKYNSGGLERLAGLGVQAIACGHDHCNDYCLQDDSASNPVWLCFGGGGGEGGYAGYGGTERRIRTFEINPQNGNIYTWKRLNGSPDQPFDQQQL